jgi:hypothetical protein
VAPSKARPTVSGQLGAWLLGPTQVAFVGPASSSALSSATRLPGWGRNLQVTGSYEASVFKLMFAPAQTNQASTIV